MRRQPINKIHHAIILFLMFAILFSGCGGNSVTPYPTNPPPHIWPTSTPTNLWGMFGGSPVPTGTSTPIPTATASATATITITPMPGLTTIEAAPSGLLLTAIDGHIVQQPAGSGGIQQWRMVPAGGGSLIQSPDGIQCLDSSAGPGLAPCSGASTQIWLTIPCLSFGGHYVCSLTGGTVWIRSAAGNAGDPWMEEMGASSGGPVLMLACDALKEGCSAPGTGVILNGMNGGWDQQWSLSTTGP